MNNAYEPRASTVHKSLLEIKTYGGVEKRMAVANGTVWAALTMGTEQPAFIFFAVVVHFILMWVTKKDPFTINVYMRYAVLGDVYDPWIRRNMKRNERPEGCCRNVLC